VFAAHLLDEDLDSADRLYRKRGFPTPSGRIEFDSGELRDAGHDGLPVYREPAEGPVSRPDLVRDYPLVLTSGGRSRYYTHTQQHNLPSTRRHDPVPRVQIHPEAAAARGIGDGERVRVSSPRGAVEFVAQVTPDLKPGVVHCFHGWAEANVNELTDDVHLDPISGFPPFKSGLCQVTRVTPEA
jgi:anaerobic selenocysteine-containing dehydrogenase